MNTGSCSQVQRAARARPGVRTRVGLTLASPPLRLGLLTAGFLAFLFLVRSTSTACMGEGEVRA